MAADSRSPQPNRDAQNNQRVTMAVLQNDIARLADVMREERDETRDLRRLAEERVRLLEVQCQKNTTDLARLDERQRATTGILGIFTLISSTIAGAVGAFVK